MILPDTAWCYIILNDIKWWYMTLLLFGKTVSALLHSSRTAPVEWRAVASGTGEHRQGSEFALRDVSLSVGSLILQGLGSKHVEVVWHYLFLRKQSKNLNKDPSYPMLLFRESRWMVFCFHQSLRWTFKRIDCKSWGRRCTGSEASWSFLLWLRVWTDVRLIVGQFGWGSEHVEGLWHYMTLWFWYILILYDTTWYCVMLYHTKWY